MAVGPTGNRPRRFLPCQAMSGSGEDQGALPPTKPQTVLSGVQPDMRTLSSSGDRDNRDAFHKMLTREEWRAAMAPFQQQTRYHAANLAAHNWDVTLVGDRLLITCPWSGGHWIDYAGQHTEITDAEYDQFYPRVRKDLTTSDGRGRWYSAAQGYDSIKRQPKMVRAPCNPQPQSANRGRIAT